MGGYFNNLIISKAQNLESCYQFILIEIYIENEITHFKKNKCNNNSTVNDGICSTFFLLI